MQLLSRGSNGCVKYKREVTLEMGRTEMTSSVQFSSVQLNSLDRVEKNRQREPALCRRALMTSSANLLSGHRRHRLSAPPCFADQQGRTSRDQFREEGKKKKKRKKTKDKLQTTGKSALFSANRATSTIRHSSFYHTYGAWSSIYLLDCPSSRSGHFIPLRTVMI